MSVIHVTSKSSFDQVVAEMDRRGSVIEQLEARIRALEDIPQDAIDALRNNQRQLDMDGCEVGVSRQAIDEVLTGLDAALASIAPQGETGHGANPAQVTESAWPIDTDDQVEALARECGIDNRKYMTPKDYSIWCEQQRKFARLAAIGAGGQVVAVKALIWEEDHGVAGMGPYRLFKAETPLGRFVYGTDAEGSAYYHTASSGVMMVGDEAKAKQLAEAAWQKTALDEVGKFVDPSALSQPHPADERVVEAERRRAVGQGMAIAVGIVMSGWGNTVYVKEILGAAGYTSVEAMKADGVEDYDIDLCRPALAELSTKEDQK